MIRTQDIVFAADGQKLVWDATEGRPTAVSSVKVFRAATGDDGTEEDAIAGSAEIDLVSTTVASASGDGQANPRRLNVTSIANMAVGRDYLIIGAAGARERVEALKLASGVVDVRNPMANAFAAADLVVGTRLTVPLRTAWVGDTAKLTGGRNQIPGYRVRWAYTVAGLRYTQDSYFDLVRYGGGHTLTTVDVDHAFPGLQGMGPGFHRTDGYRALLNEAYDRVRWDLVTVDTDDNSIRDQDALNRATLLALAVNVARSRVMQGADPRALEFAERDYGGFMEQIFKVGVKVAIEGDSSGGGELASPAPYWVK